MFRWEQPGIWTGSVIIKAKEAAKSRRNNKTTKTIQRKTKGEKKMKKVISMLMVIVSMTVLFGACAAADTETATSAPASTTAAPEKTTQTTTVQKTTQTTTQKTIYPTEAECVAAIKKEYETVTAGSGYSVSVVLDSHADNSAKYNLQVSGAPIGTVLLSSPISSEHEGYGYITGVMVMIDNSTMPYNQENMNVVLHMGAVPALAYAKLRDKHTGDTVDTFLNRFSDDRETANGYLRKISGEDALSFINKTKLSCAFAYGTDECAMLKASLQGS